MYHKYSRPASSLKATIRIDGSLVKNLYCQYDRPYTKLSSDISAQRQAFIETVNKTVNRYQNIGYDYGGIEVRYYLKGKRVSLNYLLEVIKMEESVL